MFRAVALTLRARLWRFGGFAALGNLAPQRYKAAVLAAVSVLFFRTICIPCFGRSVITG